jgi:hypothetical protein
VAFDLKNHRILATGSALTVEICKKAARKLSDQNLNALSISPDGHALAVGPKGLIVDLAPSPK